MVCKTTPVNHLSTICIGKHLRCNIGVCGETFRTHEIVELLAIDSFRPGHAPNIITALSGNYKILHGFPLHNMKLDVVRHS